MQGFDDRPDVHFIDGTGDVMFRLVAQRSFGSKGTGTRTRPLPSVVTTAVKCTERSTRAFSHRRREPVSRTSGMGTALRHRGATVMELPRTHTLAAMPEDVTGEPGRAEVKLVYFEACPHWRGALERLTEALAQVDRDDPVQLQLVTNEAEAHAHHMAGSPTILIGGRDPFPGGGPTWGCRLYPGEAGLQGALSAKRLVELLS